MRSAPHSPQVAAHHARMYSAFAAHCCADFAHAAHDPLRSAQPFGIVASPASATGTGTAVTAGLGGSADSAPKTAVSGCPSPTASGDFGAANGAPTTSLGNPVGTWPSASARTASACVGVAVTGEDVGLCSGRTGAMTGSAVSSAAAGTNSGGSVGGADGVGPPRQRVRVDVGIKSSRRDVGLEAMPQPLLDRASHRGQFVLDIV